MPDVTITLTDEQFDALVAGTPGGDKAEDRVAAYLQAQVDSIAAQHVTAAVGRRLEAVGLPASLASAGLDADQIALLEADAAPKLEAKRAALAAEVEAKALAAAPLKP